MTEYVKIPGLGVSVPVPTPKPPTPTTPKLSKYGFPYGRYFVSGHRYWFKYDPQLMTTKVLTYDHAANKWVQTVGDTEAKRVAEFIAEDALNSAQRYGKVVGACSICGRALKDEKSVKYGIDPDCAAKSFPDELEEGNP